MSNIPARETILVVGATSAIAQAALRLWADKGARLVLVARDAAKLETVAGDLGARGAETRLHVMPDLAEAGDGLALRVAEIWQEAGGLDGALIAFGDLPDQQAVQNDPEAILRQTLVNGTGVAAWLALLALRFEAARGGWIAAISSVAADRGRARIYVYGGAKALVSHHLGGLRQRLAPAGVRVIDLRPGPVLTPMTQQLGRQPLITTPEAIAPGLVRACARANGTVYLPWRWRPIMALLRHLPEFIWLKLKI